MPKICQPLFFGIHVDMHTTGLSGNEAGCVGNLTHSQRDGSLLSAHNIQILGLFLEGKKLNSSVKQERCCMHQNVYSLSEYCNVCCMYLC